MAGFSGACMLFRDPIVRFPWTVLQSTKSLISLGKGIWGFVLDRVGRVLGEWSVERIFVADAMFEMMCEWGEFFMLASDEVAFFVEEFVMWFDLVIYREWLPSSVCSYLRSSQRLQFHVLSRTWNRIESQHGWDLRKGKPNDRKSEQEILCMARPLYFINESDHFRVNIMILAKSRAIPSIPFETTLHFSSSTAIHSAIFRVVYTAHCYSEKTIFEYCLQGRTTEHHLRRSRVGGRAIMLISMPSR